MSADYSKTAVLGPIVSEPLTVVGTCTECMAAISPKDAETCPGFGPGCFGMRRAPRPETTREDLEFRFHAPREIP